MEQRTMKPMPTRRGIIRMTDGGRVAMPQTDVWMTKEEISDMLGLPEADVFRAIRTIYKKSELYEHETMERIPMPGHEHQGWTMEVYSLDLILYLTYKLPSRNAQVFRKYMTNKAYERSPYEHICIIVDDVDFRSGIRNGHLTEVTP